MEFKTEVQSKLSLLDEADSSEKLQILKDIKNLIDTYEDNIKAETTTLSDSEIYNIFPIKDEDKHHWDFYAKQLSVLWTETELDYTSDIKDFNTMPERYRELFYDIFGFFAGADGLISENLIRFFRDCNKYIQQQFLIIQTFIEQQHALSYSFTITSLIPDAKRQKEIFEMINSLDCVKRKADYIKSYTLSYESKAMRWFRSAIGEGVFFVSLFAIIFYFRSKGIMNNLIKMNQLISADEFLHRNYACKQVVELGGISREDAVKLIEEAVNIEVDHCRYILRSPIDGVEADEHMGITITNLEKFVKLLGDQILQLCGFDTHFNEDIELSWMKDINHMQKSNFYERKDSYYSKVAYEEAVDWEKRAGLKRVSTVDSVQNPDEIDF